jgi:hypothetical protein
MRKNLERFLGRQPKGNFEKRMKPLKPEVFREETKWKEVLGAYVEAPPLPPQITPQVKEALERNGFELAYIPKLDIGTLEELKKSGIEKFLDKMETSYPNWRKCPYWDEDIDSTMSINLEYIFWKFVEEGKIDFPQLPGAWIAIGPAHSFGDSPLDADKFIEEELKPQFLEETGLKEEDIEMRIPTALEWNLLANHEGWGENEGSYEWTSTNLNFRNGSEDRRIRLGGSKPDGVARFESEPLDQEFMNIILRHIVVFK